MRSCGRSTKPKRKNELNRILAQSLFSRHSFSYSGIPLHLPNLLLPGLIEPDTEYLALPKPKSSFESSLGINPSPLVKAFKLNPFSSSPRKRLQRSSSLH